MESIYGGSGAGAVRAQPSTNKSDGTYTLKKVLIQNDPHLEQVRQEIRVSSQLSHPNLLPLLENAIITVKEKKSFEGRDVAAVPSNVGPADNEMHWPLGITEVALTDARSFVRKNT
ncbi:hypothetical protein E2562_003906 [Oryza meyeriana var. granulata]|uniref:Protein kinase domain-containing protein n=1 Tax=Oryza meyeriana var. granulata TaxID=110450 RepID=A0A6G1CY01_9ORYZ|nr:hypothetical protein E2562_003906 [Oryza meyeriana var. granulata]